MSKDDAVLREREHSLRGGFVITFSHELAPAFPLDTNVICEETL